MLIGIVSDIHGTLTESAEQALSGCDAILCAGDVGRSGILHRLEGIAPTIAVRGNCDGFPEARSLPALVSPRFDGVRFRMTHRPQDIGRIPDDVRIVVHGHTHVKRADIIDRTLFFNPGSPIEPRKGDTASVARITVEDGVVVSWEFIAI